MLTLYNLRTESTVNPLGIDHADPRFSWKLRGEVPGLRQSAYQVQVAFSPEKLEDDRPDAWDSGKISSSENFDVNYMGWPPESGQRLYWRARAWDQDGNPGPYSAIAWFETALLSPEEWLAEWIGFPAGFAGKALYLRHDFTIDQPVTRARIYAAGLGYSEIYLNGAKLGQAVLDPAPTDYARTILYNTYDATPALQSGVNAIGAILGSGWYGSPRLILQLRLDYADGTTQWVLTGRVGQPGGAWWRVAQGAVQENSLYDGEVYDARLEDANWCKPAPPQSGGMVWSSANVVESPGGRLVAQPQEPIQVVETLRAPAITQPRPGVFVYDFGQNMAGWARLTAQGAAGTKITLKFAETLYADGTINQENLRSARATDVYIMKGSGVEAWEPRFTYHGFRYTQVEGYPGTPHADSIQARVVRSAVERSGEFACSNEMLNRIEKLVRWTEGSNLHGILTDCPQRDERMGWLNDLSARTDEALFNFDLERLLAKFTGDMAYTQDNQGRIADTAPYHWGSRPADPVSAAFLLIPWQMYRHYGQRRALEQHFEAFGRWVDFLYQSCEDGILGYSYYGDWAPPIAHAIHPDSAYSKDTPGALVSTAFLKFSLDLLAKIADAIGMQSISDNYRYQAAEVAEAYHRKFFDPSSGGYGSNNQACNALSLYMGLVPEEYQQGVLDNLLADVEKQDYHLTTGNLCSKYVLEVLSDMGHAGAALKLATQTSYPSWGYMLDNGATTIWERWEKATGGGMNSHNHPMYASVGAWLYKVVAGIDLDGDCGAFRQVTIWPRLTTELDWARASVQTAQGPLKVDWRREAGKLTLNVTIPANVQAKIILPDGEVQQVGSGEYEFQK